MKLRPIAMTILVAISSIMAGFVLMWPLAMTFDSHKWPMFHTWALAHGTWMFAWPVLSLIAFGIIIGCSRLVSSAVRDRRLITIDDRREPR